MIFSAIIRNENEILLQKVSEMDNKIIYELPNCEVTNSNNPIDSLVESCNNLNVTIEVTNVFYEGESDNCPSVVYNTELISYSATNGVAVWVNSKELKNLIFTKLYEDVVNKLVCEYEIANNISNEIEQTVIDMSKALGSKIKCVSSYNSYSVFVESDYGSYCPFVFSIIYRFESEKSIEVIQSWRIARMYADGDKTDLYVLFANLMSIALRCLFKENVYIDYLSIFDNIEINAASIIFNKIDKHLDIKKLRQVIEQNYSMYIMSLFYFERLIGSFSLIIDDEKFISRYTNYFHDKEKYNYISRENHQYYFNYEKGVALICINNGVFNGQNLMKKHRWKILDGIDGKIFYQIDGEEESFNYVSHYDWERIMKVVNDMGLKNYSIVCQENHLYLLEGNCIWIFEGDFRKYWVEEEKKKILDRQALENKILHFNRNFKWKYPVNPGRFEELIADLVETENMIQSVRLVGKVNNPDRKRDLLIYKNYMKEEGAYFTALIIGQCKAYEKSVRKSHVTDIRDTIEFNNADGYFLAVTSNMTTELIDHLIKLKENRDIDWWTEREIFKKLRQNSYIADRYLDILSIE